MRVFTPDEVATGTESKYLGVLVAAKYSRELNTLPSEAMPLGEEKKLTTRVHSIMTSRRLLNPTLRGFWMSHYLSPLSGG